MKNLANSERRKSQSNQRLFLQRKRQSKEILIISSLKLKPRLEVDKKYTKNLADNLDHLSIMCRKKKVIVRKKS